MSKWRVTLTYELAQADDIEDASSQANELADALRGTDIDCTLEAIAVGEVPY